MDGRRDEHNLVAIKARKTKRLLLAAVVVAAQPVARQVVRVERLLASSTAAAPVIAARGVIMNQHIFRSLNEIMMMSQTEVEWRGGDKHGGFFLEMQFSSIHPVWFVGDTAKLPLYQHFVKRHFHVMFMAQ